MNRFKTRHIQIIMLIMVVAASLAILEIVAETTAEPQKEIHLTVSAGASLKNATEEIKNLYISQHPGVSISLNFGSSGQLLQQIEQGAPVDVFISAAKEQMDRLAAEDLIDKTTLIDILGNDLVLVVPDRSTEFKDWADLLKPQVVKLAIGETQTVPCGKYAEEALKSLGLWAKIQPKIVMGSDVRQVLAFVESNNAEAGFVYRSDAFVSKNVRIAAVVDDKLHSPIIYPAAVIKSSSEKETAQEFVKFLSNPEAQQIFVSYGFKPLD